MNVKEFLKTTQGPIRKVALCSDGFSISIQGSRCHYCSPKLDLDDGNYESLELGFPSESDSLIIKYADHPTVPTKSIYAYVPMNTVETLIEKHGGIVV